MATAQRSTSVVGTVAPPASGGGRARATLAGMIGDFDALCETWFRSVPDSAGVVRPAAVTTDAEGRWRILRIGPSTPKSPTDSRVLALARARADLVITTGKILRDEPNVTLDPPEALRARVESFRSSELGRTEAPVPMILTSGRDFDPAHRMIAARGAAIVATDASGKERLDASGLPGSIRVVALPEPGIRGAIAWARDELGVEAISIDAGPTAANPLHDEPLLVDEIYLSVFKGRVAEEVLGFPFVSRTHLEASFMPASERVSVDEASGRWTFQRFVRRG